MLLGKVQGLIYNRFDNFQRASNVQVGTKQYSMNNGHETVEMMQHHTATSMLQYEHTCWCIFSILESCDMWFQVSI